MVCRSNDILGTDGFLNALNGFGMNVLQSLVGDDFPSLMFFGLFVVACTLDFFLINHKLDYSFHVSQTLEFLFYFLLSCGLGIFLEHTGVDSPYFLVLEGTINHQNFSNEELWAAFDHSLQFFGVDTWSFGGCLLC